MKDISTSIPISRAKSDLLEIIRRLENVEDAVAKNGVPAAVIFSMEKYQHPCARREGKWVKYDEVFGR